MPDLAVSLMEMFCHDATGNPGDCFQSLHGNLTSFIM